jgi:hypothetical protein
MRAFLVRALYAPAFEASMVLLQGVGGMLEEDQPEDDVLVLDGVRVRAQRAVRGPCRSDLEGKAL